MTDFFFITQWRKPSKGDWTAQVKTDLVEINIMIDFEYIKSKSKDTFKKLVQTKSKEIAWYKLITQKESHSKLKNISYCNEMKIQDYFVREDLNTKQKKLIFKLRTRMAEFGENYRGGPKK